MSRFEILFQPAVEKDLRPLPRSAVTRILTRIEALAIEPSPRACLKLAGAEELYRICVGDYRVIYGIDRAARKVTVHHVRTRKDAYRDL